MPEKLSVLERIARDIETTLIQVRADTGAFANTFHVERRKVRGNAPKATQLAKGHVHAVIFQPPPTKLDQDQMTEKWEQPFAIDLYVCPDEDAAEPIDSRINSARADCEYALTREVATSYKRAGLAIDTVAVDPEPFEDPGGLPGIQVRVIVTYETEWRDPFTSPYSNIDN